MASLPPPALTPPTPPPARIVAEGSDLAGLIHVRLEAAPGTAGVNTFEVLVTDEEGDLHEGVTGVRLSFRLPSRPDVAPPSSSSTRAEGGVWRGGRSEPLGGGRVGRRRPGPPRR